MARAGRWPSIRLDLYDAIGWFDDWMHVLNTALVSAAFVILTVARSATFAETAAAAVAMGLTASLGRELFEYATFLIRSTEWTSACSDTIGDLSQGWFGSPPSLLSRSRPCGATAAPDPERGPRTWGPA